MKKLLSIFLIICLLFTSLLPSNVYAEESSYDITTKTLTMTELSVSEESEKVTTTLLESDFNDADGTNWYRSNSSRISYKDEDGDGVNDYAQLILDANGKTGHLCSSPVVITPEKEYKITFYARVPSDSAPYIGTNASGTAYTLYPKFAIYQPTLNTEGTKVTDYHGEGKNEYAYASAKYGTVRRSEFSIDWQIGDYGSETIIGYSLIKAQFYDICKDADGNKISANDALKDWTKVTCTFTGLDDTENVGPQTVALDFSLATGVAGLKVDVKDVQLVETSEATVEPEEPETPEESDAIGLNEGFEDYNVDDVLYDHTLTDEQDFYVYGSSSATLLTSFGDLKVTDSVAYSGTKSMYGKTYFQNAAKPVKLEPNTEYTLSFWFSYQNSNPDIYVGSLTYGIYTPNATTNKMVAAIGTNMTSQRIFNSNFKSGEWKKITHTFTTGDNTDNLLFCYRYNDVNATDDSTPNKTPLYLDDIIIEPSADVVKSQINLSVKTSASVEFIGTNRFDYFVGERVDFKVVTANNLTPKVNLGSTELTADANGVYSFVAADKQRITVVCDGDDDLRDANVDKNGYPLDSFNETLATKPVWEGNTVYHENVLFIPGRETAKLIYPISEAVSVRSYDLYTNYLEGVDYEITEDGQLKILEGSRIPVYTKPLETSSSSNNLNQSFPIVGKENTYAAFISDYAYPAYAISVTYEHTELWEDGYNPYVIESVKKDIPEVFKKLENGEDVNIVIYGDSASCGWSSSGLNYVKEIYNANGVLVDNVLNVAPYTPPWPKLLESQLKKLYPNANITFKNLALGGKHAEWGAKNIVTRLGYLGDNWDTDLMILAYGANDLTAGHSRDTFKTNMQNIIDTVRLDSTGGAGPDTEILLWSQYICNTDVEQYTLDKHMAYRDVYLELASENEGVGLSDSIGEFAEIIKSKEIVDIFNTNVNHGNDFLTRVIAQCLIASLSQPKYLAGDIDDNNTSNLKDLVSLARYVAKWENLSINEYALDINGDDVVDLNDVTALAKHLAGWPEIEVSGTVYPEYNTVYRPMIEAVTKMKLSNRTAMNGDLLELGWSYSGFTVQGHFSGEFAINDVKLSRANLVYAVLDGDLENAHQIIIENNSDKVTLFGNIDPGFHTIQLIKASEGYYTSNGTRLANNITIGGITYNGTLFSAPAEKELKIEFIGDSITSSMGLYTVAQEPNSVLRTDITKGYAIRVAEYFDADFNVVSCSNGSVCTEAPYMYDQYQKRYFDGEEYDFTTRTEPDVVVIALGANDVPAYIYKDENGKTQINTETIGILEKGMNDMLTMVRSHNPNAKIVWLFGMMEVRAASFMKQTVEKFAETDSNVHYVLVNRNDCSGQGGHPTPEGHAANAEEFIAYLESNVLTK